MDAVSMEQEFITFLGGGNLAKLIAATILVIVIAVVSHMVIKWIKHLMNKEDSRLPQSTFLLNVIRFLFWGVGLSFILNACFGVDMNALVAALGVGGIAISLGAQETIANFIGGVAILLMQLIKVGDNIRIGSDQGVVQDITWRHTTIKNLVGETVIIPNSVISKTSVVILPKIETVIVHFYVSAARDLNVVADEVIQRTHMVADHLAAIEINPKVVFTEIGEFATKGKVLVTIDDPEKAVAVKDAITRAIAPLVSDPQSRAPEEELLLGKALFQKKVEEDLSETARLRAQAVIAAAEAVKQEEQEAAEAVLDEMVATHLDSKDS